MNIKFILLLIVCISGVSFFAGLIMAKKTFIPIAMCNKQLYKMQSYYLDNIYVKFGVKEAKDERQNIEKFCYIK